MSAAYVQGATATASSTTSVAQSFPGDTTAGNLLVSVSGSSGDTVTHTAGSNTPAEVANATKTSSHTAMWYVEGCAGGAETITASRASSTFWGLCIAEYSGVESSGALDDFGTGATFGSAISTASFAASQDDTLLVMGVSSLPSRSISSWDGGYTGRLSSGGLRPAFLGDQESVATGSYQGDATLSANDDWSCVAASFVPAAGGGGGVSIPVLYNHYHRNLAG